MIAARIARTPRRRRTGAFRPRAADALVEAFFAAVVLAAVLVLAARLAAPAFAPALGLPVLAVFFAVVLGFAPVLVLAETLAPGLPG